MERFDQTIQKRLAVLVTSALAFGIFAPNEVKAQQAGASSTRQEGDSSSASSENGGQDNTGQDFTSHRTFSSCVISIRLRRERVA